MEEINFILSQSVRVRYTNWRGETADRTIEPYVLWFGSTKFHPTPQWLLKAWDVEKETMRDFALKDMVPIGSLPAISEGGAA